MKRIGLMGCGTVAGYGHLPALQECDRLELVSIFDPDEGRLVAAKDKFGVPNAFMDAAAFFESGLDAVTITSPAPRHIDNVRDAVRYGKHILCEKPLAMNDAVGDVRSIRMIYIWNCHGRYQIDENGKRIEQPRRAGRMLEGGPMVDCGVHDIDLARWWLGSEVIRQQGAGAWVEDYEAPDHVYVHLDHANGAHTMVEISYTYCHTAKEPVHFFSYDLIGTDGVIRFDGLNGLLEVRSAEGTERFHYGSAKNFVGMYTEFAHALETGQPGNMPTAQDGLIATRIARTATEHIIANRPR